MDAALVLPEAGSGPGVVLLHEIFGINAYVTGAAERLAELGYVVLVPDLFWRTDPGFALDERDEESLARGMEVAGRLDRQVAVTDAIAALGALRGRPEVTGRVGVLGFCLGGALAYLVAAEGDPDAAVCYYGSGIADALDAAGQITCPVLFHFGADDRFIPRDQANRVAALAAGRPEMTCHIHAGAGHAFDNPAPMFHGAAAAAAAWAQTGDFLAQTLGPLAG